MFLDSSFKRCIHFCWALSSRVRSSLEPRLYSSNSCTRASSKFSFRLYSCFIFDTWCNQIKTVGTEMYYIWGPTIYSINAAKDKYKRLLPKWFQMKLKIFQSYPPADQPSFGSPWRLCAVHPSLFEALGSPAASLDAHRWHCYIRPGLQPESFAAAGFHPDTRPAPHSSYKYENKGKINIMECLHFYKNVIILYCCHFHKSLTPSIYYVM